MSSNRGSAKKERPITDIGLAFRRFFSTVFLLRCPNCGQGNIARNLFNIKDECDSCHAKFERGDSGNWMIASTLNYFITAILGVLLTVFLIRAYGFFDGLAYVVAGTALVLVVLLYRPAKTLAVWILWLFGFVYPN